MHVELHTGGLYNDARFIKFPDMKKYFVYLLTLLLIIVSVFPSFAQVVSDTTRFSESLWSMKKKRMVLDYMDLSEGEKAAFWPLYENYYQAIRYIEMETVEILDLYHRSAGTLPPDDYERYTKRILLNDLLLAKVRRQYFKKFSKALSPVIATEFMQFDDTMRMVLRLDVKSKAEEASLAKASLR